MAQLKVRILGSGTSQGIPVIGCPCAVCSSRDPRDKRLRTSALLTRSDTRVLIDVGPDFRQQMLAAGEDDLDAVLISHEHNDHVAGLDDIRPINFQWRKHIPLYAEERVVENIRSRFAYIFDTTYHYPGKPRIELRTHGTEPFTIGKLECIPIRVYHGVLPIWGYRFGGFCYLTDAKTVPRTEMEKLSNLDVLIVNALQIKRHQTHFNLEEALAFIERVKPGMAYLTHLSHRMGLHTDLQATLPEGVAPAYDGMELVVEV